MVQKKDDSGKRSRVTPSDLTRIKRLSRGGMSISDIATAVGFHRHTIRKHLQEKYEDIVAEAARTQVLSEELKRHFKQLNSFALNDLKSRLDASVAGVRKSGKQRPQGPVNTSGLLGLPYPATALSMSDEWVRMYKPPAKEDFLLKSLQLHTEDLSLWKNWDSWRRIVSAYEKSSSYLWTWLEEKLEESQLENIDLQRAALMMRWLFGNMLIMASGGKQGDLSTFRVTAFDPAEATIGRDQEKDTDGSRASFKFLTAILKKVQNISQWEELRSSAAELGSRKSQLELKRLARDIDYALVSFELMEAFGGYCPLCPIKQT